MPSGLAAGTYYIFARADADGTVFETYENNNNLVRAISVGPDLIVTSLAAPAAVAPGSVVSIGDTVKNQGGGLTGASTTRFYLSTNVSFDGADILLDGGRQVPSLSTGASSTGSTAVAIPADLAVGTYYLIARADADNVVAETYETNNTLVRAVQSGADLVVSGFTVPFAIGAGTTILITDTTKNQGSGPAGRSTTRFYLSTNLALDAADTLLSSGRAVDALAAGMSSSGSTSVTIPAELTVGTYYVIAKADGDNSVVESAEANNTLVRAVVVGPDLAVSGLQAPTTAAAGAAVGVTDTVKNQGAGASGASVTRFYLSANFSLDAADTVLEGFRSVPALGPGASSTGTTSVTLPQSLGVGTYYIIAKADADEAVAETFENNNTAARAVMVGPDLTVTMLQAPLAVASGAVISVTDTMKNAGAEPAPASTTRFYLSTNVTLDAADIALEGSRSVPVLLQGALSSGTTSVTIPAGLAPGSYYIIAKTDADGLVQETTETNNTFAKTIQITAGT
jgi:subtilase family serine protease